MKEIPLTRGLVAIVDDDVYEEVSQYKWCVSASGRVYASRRPNAKNPHRFMHRMILGLTPKKLRDEEADHRNGNTLDNRKENLRVATHAQNVRNRGTNRRLSHKGIRRESGKYRAYIKPGNRQMNLGLYETKTDALAAYDTAAKTLFGEFARTNADIAA